MSKSTGTVKFFNEKKGFGFIIPDQGGKELFFHVNNLVNSSQTLREGQNVEYSEGQGRKGPEATEVATV